MEVITSIYSAALDGSKLFTESTQIQQLYGLVPENRYIRIALGIFGVLTARKILDIVRRKWYNYPPGPVGIPFFGGFFEFINFNKLRRAQHKYGPIYLTHFGFSHICIINDYSLLHQIFGSKEFNDRVVPDYGSELPFSGIRVHNGWNQRRKLMKNNMIAPLNSKILKSLIENALNQCIFPIIDDCSKNNQPWMIQKEMNYVAFATVYGSIFGDSCPSPNDELFQEFLRLNNIVFEKLLSAIIARLFFPSFFAAWINRNILRFEPVIRSQRQIIQQWIDKYEENKQKLKNENNKPDTSGLYYELISESDEITHAQGLADMNVSFEAGMHTTGRALEQGLLYLAKIGDSYQNELYNEIENVKTSKEYNSNDILKNRSHLPKLTSFIYEVLRVHGGVRTTLTREIYDKNVTITVPKEISHTGKKIEYVIPKGTSVFGNVLAMNRNENYWNGKNVMEFDQYRFYNSESNTFVGKQQMSTFGAGRRNCAGQELAMRELYLVLSMLIQRYMFDIPQTCKTKDEFVIPKDYQSAHAQKPLGVSVRMRHSL